MKYVGEAVRDHALANGRTNVVAIGIASWGILAHREKLQDENVSVCNDSFTNYKFKRLIYFRLFILFIIWIKSMRVYSLSTPPPKPLPHTFRISAPIALKIVN